MAAFTVCNRQVDPAVDVEVVMSFLQEGDSPGTKSFHAEDELSDGRLLRDVVWGINAAPGSDAAPGDLKVIASITETFGSGFDLARAEDFVDDETTIGDILDIREPAPVAPAS